MKKKHKIMLVEDDKTQAMMYEMAFNAEGYKLILAHNGKEGIRLVHAHKPDLVLLDLLLGEVSGMEVLEDIKASDDTKDIKVIMLSNFTKKGLLEECKGKGALDFLVKSKYIPKDIVRLAEKTLS